MSLTKIDPGEDRVRDVRGNAIANARIITDYHDDLASVNRSAALLQVVDYSSGSGDKIDVNGSNDSFELTEGVEFNAATDNATTAENIATYISNNVSNYDATDVTGHSWNPYVSIQYTNGHIDSVQADVSSSDAWKFRSYNSNVCASTPCEEPIAAIYDDTGSQIVQPQFSNSNGYYSYYVDNKATVDFWFEHPSANFTETHISDITLSGGANVVTPTLTTDHAIARWDETDGEGLLDSKPTIANDGTINVQGNSINNLLSLNDIKFSSQYADLQTALNALSNGDKLIIDKEHTISSTQTLSNVNDIDIEFTRSGKITASGLSGTMLEISGNKTATSLSLNSNVSEEDETIPVTNPETAGFAVGDLILIRSDRVWTASQASRLAGELKYVESASDASDQITVQGGLFDGYTTANNAEIVKIVPIKNINIENLKLTGGGTASGDLGLDIKWADNVTVSKGLVENLDSRGIGFEGTLNTRVENIKAKDIGSSGVGYGVVWINANQYGKVVNSQMENVRHGADVGGDSNNAGIGRFITFENCSAYDTWASGFQFHNNSEYCKMINLESVNAESYGLSVLGYNNKVLGGKVKNSSSSGATIQNPDDASPQLTVKDVQVESPGSHGIYVLDISITIEGCEIYNPSDEGIYCYAANKNIEKIHVSGNEVQNAEAVGIHVKGTASYTISEILIENNFIKNSGDNSIYILYSSNGVVNDNKTISGYRGFSLGYCSGFIVSGNKANGALYHGLKTYNSQAPYNLIHGNHLTDNNTDGGFSNLTTDANDTETDNKTT